MAFDEIIESLSDYGSYTNRIIFLLMLPALFSAFHMLGGVFLVLQPDFRCRLPFENATNVQYQAWPMEQWQQAYPPQVGTDEKLNTCQYFENVTFDEQNNTLRRLSNHTTRCEHFVFDKTWLLSSVVTEWCLVCEKSSLRAFSESMFMLGVFFGSITFGQLSDVWGRKPLFLAAVVCKVSFGILAAMATNYYTYTLARMLIGASNAGVFLVPYVMASEMASSRKRLYVAIGTETSFAVGFMLTALIAYFIRDWRQLQLALSLPGILFFCYIWVIPESLRWQLSKGRKQQVLAFLQQLATKYNAAVSSETYNLLESSNEATLSASKPKAKGSFFDLFKYPFLRCKTLVIFFEWFIISGSYYGLSWNTSNLGGNVFLNVLVAGAVELPAFACLFFTLNKYGRRAVLSTSLLLAGVSLLSTAFIPSELNWLLICLAMLGKSAITAAYSTIYMFSVEQFPTVVRNVGLGASSMIARIGGILAPYLIATGNIWRPLPLIIYGFLAIVGAMLSRILPETLNKPMPETIQEAEEFGKKSIHNAS